MEMAPMDKSIRSVWGAFVSRGLLELLVGDEEKGDKHAADWRLRHLAKVGKGVSPCSPSVFKQSLYSDWP